MFGLWMWALGALAAENVAITDIGLAEGAHPAWPIRDTAFLHSGAHCVVDLALSPAGQFTVDAVRDGATMACPPVFAETVSQAYAGAVADAKTIKAHGASVFSVDVLFELTPGIILVPETSTLLDAAVVPVEPPKKFYNKPTFRSRDAKKGRCDVELWVDAEGTPYAADLRACRDDLRLPVEMSVMEWRFTPVLVGGAAVPVRFHTDVVVK